MTPKVKKPGRVGTAGRTLHTKRPPQVHGTINAGKGVSSAQHAVSQVAQKGRPGGTGQPNTPPPAQHNTPPPVKPAPPTHPMSPPPPSGIRHTAASEKHILGGDGGNSSKGGHLAGTGFTDKTEFPAHWDRAKVLDAAHRVTQHAGPSKGPYLTKDANGNPAWAYDYTGTVDGVTVKTTVTADGEIRTAYPPNRADPGVLYNEKVPQNVKLTGLPAGVPPHYSHPALGGDGSWSWEGAKGDRIVRVVLDQNGTLHPPVDLGPRKKK